MSDQRSGGAPHFSNENSQEKYKSPYSGLTASRNGPQANMEESQAEYSIHQNDDVD
jgi:hypothetical protein